MGVGHSEHQDSRTAAGAATQAALVGVDPKLLVVFAGIDHDPPALLRGMRTIIDDVPIIGCSTQGEIGPYGARDNTVVVAAIGGPGFSVETAVATEVSGRQRRCGADVARCATGLVNVQHQPNRVLMLLTDGLTRDQEAILRGCYRELGASVPLFGGAAADGWRMTGAYMIGDDRVHADAVIAAAITSDAPLSVAVRHGWREAGEPMIVTSTNNGRVYTMDDKPALDLYLDRLNAPPEAYTDAAAFTQFALSRPLGVRRRSGVEARNVSTEVDIAGRSIGGGSAIDHGSLVWAMTGDEESIAHATDQACEQALGGLGGHEPVGMLAMSCAGLRPVLGDDGTRRETERLAKWAGGIPFAGFHTYGEIARVRGIDGFHNQTLAVLALA
jgi:hypothetical protein